MGSGICLGHVLGYDGEMPLTAPPFSMSKIQHRAMTVGNGIRAENISKNSDFPDCVVVVKITRIIFNGDPRGAKLLLCLSDTSNMAF